MLGEGSEIALRLFARLDCALLPPLKPMYQEEGRGAGGAIALCLSCSSVAWTMHRSLLWLKPCSWREVGVWGWGKAALRVSGSALVSVPEMLIGWCVHAAVCRHMKGGVQADAGTRKDQTQKDRRTENEVGA